MAKKSRRARQVTQKPAQPVRIAQPARPVVAQVAVKEVDFRQEYHYVIEDLKRIAIIASALLLLLVAMAVIIR
jgi:hypothetical protein